MAEIMGGFHVVLSFLLQELFGRLSIGVPAVIGVQCRAAGSGGPNWEGLCV